MEAVEDLLATIFLAAMAVLLTAGIYVYQGLQTGEPGVATPEPAAKLVTVAAAKP